MQQALGRHRNSSSRPTTQPITRETSTEKKKHHSDLQETAICKLNPISRTFGLAYTLPTVQILSIAECSRQVLLLLDSAGIVWRVSPNGLVEQASHKGRKLTGVVQIVANRYCAMLRDSSGQVFVQGEDNIKIGILGLGSDIILSEDFERIEIKEKVKQLSLSESYAVALTHDNDIYIWGTTLDHFFCENISQTHFIPTKLSLSHQFKLDYVFACNDSMFLIAENGVIECFTKLSGVSEDSRSLSSYGKRNNSSESSGYRLSKFCDGRIMAISQFGYFTVFLSTMFELYVYDRDNREIHAFDQQVLFDSTSTSKTRLLAHSSKMNQLHIVAAPLYAKKSFSMLERRILNVPESCLFYQTRLDHTVLMIMPSELLNNSSDLICPSSDIRMSVTKSKQLIFEKSFVRMRYKEMRDRTKTPEKTVENAHTHQKLNTEIIKGLNVQAVHKDQKDIKGTPRIDSSRVLEDEINGISRDASYDQPIKTDESRILKPLVTTLTGNLGAFKAKRIPKATPVGDLQKNASPKFPQALDSQKLNQKTSVPGNEAQTQTELNKLPPTSISPLRTNKNKQASNNQSSINNYQSTTSMTNFVSPGNQRSDTFQLSSTSTLQQQVGLGSSPVTPNMMKVVPESPEDTQAEHAVKLMMANYQSPKEGKLNSRSVKGEDEEHFFRSRESVMIRSLYISPTESNDQKLEEFQNLKNNDNNTKAFNGLKVVANELITPQTSFRKNLQVNESGYLIEATISQDGSVHPDTIHRSNYISISDQKPYEIGPSGFIESKRSMTMSPAQTIEMREPQNMTPTLKGSASTEKLIFTQNNLNTISELQSPQLSSLRQSRDAHHDMMPMISGMPSMLNSIPLTEIRPSGLPSPVITTSQNIKISEGAPHHFFDQSKIKAQYPNWHNFVDQTTYYHDDSIEKSRHKSHKSSITPTRITSNPKPPLPLKAFEKVMRTTPLPVVQVENSIINTTTDYLDNSTEFKKNLKKLRDLCNNDRSSSAKISKQDSRDKSIGPNNSDSRSASGSKRSASRHSRITKDRLSTSKRFANATPPKNSTSFMVSKCVRSAAIDRLASLDNSASAMKKRKRVNISQEHRSGNKSMTHQSSMVSSGTNYPPFLPLIGLLVSTFKQNQSVNKRTFFCRLHALSLRQHKVRVLARDLFKVLSKNQKRRLSSGFMAIRSQTVVKFIQSLEMSIDGMKDNSLIQVDFCGGASDNTRNQHMRAFSIGSAEGSKGSKTPPKAPRVNLDKSKDSKWIKDLASNPKWFGEFKVNKQGAVVRRNDRSLHNSSRDDSIDRNTKRDRSQSSIRSSESAKQSPLQVARDIINSEKQNLTILRHKSSNMTNQPSVPKEKSIQKDKPKVEAERPPPSLPEKSTKDKFLSWKDIKNRRMYEPGAYKLQVKVR